MVIQLAGVHETIAASAAIWLYLCGGGYHKKTTVGVGRYPDKTMVRLWVGEEDYGTMSEAAANAYIEVNRERRPEESCRVEPVEDDAPTFLPEDTEPD